MRIRSTRLILATLVVAGASAVYIGSIVVDGYLPGVLLEVGVGLALFGSLFALERSLERRVDERIDQQGRSIADVQDRVAEVEAQSSEMATRLADLGALTREAIEEKDEIARQAFDRFDEEVSMDTTRRLLLEANRIVAIDPKGVRVMIEGSPYRACFHAVTEKSALTDQPRGTIEVVIEDPAGHAQSTLTWRRSEPAPEFMADLADKLKSIGAYNDYFDGGRILERLRDTIKVAIEARSGVGGRTNLGSVIEIPKGQWAITANGVESLDDSILVPFDRVEEDGWLEQMAEMDWVDFPDFKATLLTARAMQEKMEFDRLHEAPF